MHLWADSGYRGEEDKGKDWVEKMLGWTAELVQRPSEARPQRGVDDRAEQWLNEGIEVDWESYCRREDSKCSHIGG